MVLWALNFLSRMIMVISQNNPWLRCSFSDLSTATEYSVSVADINFRLGISADLFSAKTRQELCEELWRCGQKSKANRQPPLLKRSSAKANYTQPMDG